jgi:hypothetical protein
VDVAIFQNQANIGFSDWRILVHYAAQDIGRILIQAVFVYCLRIKP